MPRLILLFIFILLNACAQKSTTEAQINNPVIKQTLLTDTERGLQRIASLQRTALIIGNSDYEGGYSGTPLKNPVNDANALAAALKKLNFQLVHDAPLLDANKQQMEHAIKDFTLQLKQGDLGLFFYAGHGMQIDGINYLIPLGTEFKSKADVKYNSVDLNWVLAELESAQNPVNFILLDACRDNPFRGFRSSQKGLAESRAPEGSLISFATGPGKVAADGISQDNSPYTKALLSALTQPGLEVLSLFKYVRRDVKKSTQNQQTPWESHSLTEDIYFNGGPKDQITDQQLLEELISIREQHQLSEYELQQELKKARDDAQRIRNQAQRIGISISPSLSQGELNDFERALLIQQKQLVLNQQKNSDEAEYKKAKSIHTSAAYLHYLKSCYPSCTYNDEAESTYKQLSTTENERAYQQALSKSTSTAFQEYLDQCNTPCPHKQQAQSYLEITQSIEQQAEQDAAYFAQARKMATVPALAAYLTSCKICLETQQINSLWSQQQIAQLPALALQQLNNAPRESLSAILKAKIAAQEKRLKSKELPTKTIITTKVPVKTRVIAVKKPSNKPENPEVSTREQNTEEFRYVPTNNSKRIKLNW